MRAPIRITKEVIDSAFKKAAEVLANPKKDLNKDLLLKVADFIETSPRYRQSTFGQPSKKSPCGTVCCIAGEIVLQSGFTLPEFLALTEQVPASDQMLTDVDSAREEQNVPRIPIPELAYALSGLKQAGRWHVFVGFPEEGWPKKFVTEYQDSPNKGAASFLRAIANGEVSL
jgi:hypothetical protein